MHVACPAFPRDPTADCLLSEDPDYEVVTNDPFVVIRSASCCEYVRSHPPMFVRSPCPDGRVWPVRRSQAVLYGGSMLSGGRRRTMQSAPHRRGSPDGGVAMPRHSRRTDSDGVHPDQARTRSCGSSHTSITIICPAAHRRGGYRHAG